ncbi:galanin receptor type 1-like [Saccostrea cucullata]|uniref:galanin receptor type 1-like n=1 Tax=Saccostrea cuccullata TaxID=36930 RepID=UPI002ED2CA7A
MENTSFSQTTISIVSRLVLTTQSQTMNISCSWKLPAVEWFKVLMLSLGFIGNGLAFCVICKNTNLHSKSFAIIAVLALSDGTYCLGGVLWGLLYYAYMDPSNFRNLQNCVGDFSYTYIKNFIACVMSAAYVASGFFIATLSVFRYMVIARPSKSDRILKKASVIFTIITVYILSIVIAAVKTFYSDKHKKKINKILDFVLSYLIPLMIMIVFHVIKISIVKSEKTGRLNPSLRKLDQICLAIILTFFILPLPWHLLALLYEFGVIDPAYMAVTISAFLLQLNNCINPIFYVFLSRRVRQTISSCFCRKESAASQTGPTELSSL